MRYFLIVGLVLLSINYSFSQQNVDFGILAGGASYLGDINTSKPFYKPSLSIGIMARYKINPRYAVRLSGYYLGLKADLSDFPENIIPGILPNQTFNRTIYDISAQAEFNFLPYLSANQPGEWTPYLAGGVGYATNVGIIIPFGVGAKLNITTKLSAGVEWSCRRTFTDNIDYIESFLGNTFINNNDWYSIYGLFITYKFFNFEAECPAYK